MATGCSLGRLKIVAPRHWPAAATLVVQQERQEPAALLSLAAGLSAALVAYLAPAVAVESGLARFWRPKPCRPPFYRAGPALVAVAAGARLIPIESAAGSVSRPLVAKPALR